MSEADLRRGPGRELAGSSGPVDLRTPGILFAAAILAYLPGIAWGLPLGIGPAWTDGWSPDEIAPLGFGEIYHALFSVAPRFSYQYPLFHYAVQLVACAPALLGLWVTGGLREFSATWPYGLADPAFGLRALTLAGRIPSLLMGAGTVVVAHRIGRETWGPRAGVLGAVGSLLAAPLVFYAKTANVDVPALFWTALGIAAFAACARRGVTPRRVAAFGAFAALAIGTKDTAYAPFLAMAPALAFLPGPETDPGGGRWPSRARWRTLGAGAAIAVGLYAVTSGLTLHPGRWWAHVRFLVRGPLDGYWAGTPTPEEFLVTLGRAADVWAGTVGVPLALAGVAGIALAVRERSRSLTLLLPALGAVLGVAVPWRFVFPRFFLVPALILALFAGYGLDRLLGARRSIARWAGIAAAVGALGWAATRDADLTRAMLVETREEAARWLERTARPGDCVAHTFWISKLPRLPEGVRTLEIPWREDPVAVMAAARPRFLVEVAASPGEEEFEYLVTPELRRWLTSPAGGYALALDLPYPGRVTGRLVAWVSPPVRIWVRSGAAPGDGGPGCVDPRTVTLP